MKDFHCRDAGMNCDFVARGNDEREVVRQAAEHARASHQLNMTPDVEQKVRGLIHDEGSDAHKRSAARR